jgi:hypothetical protein
LKNLWKGCRLDKVEAILVDGELDVGAVDEQGVDPIVPTQLKERRHCWWQVNFSIDETKQETCGTTSANLC